MNQDQVFSIIRNVVTAIAGFIATYSVGTDQQLANVSALVIALAMLVWGLFDSSNRPVITLARKAIQALAPVLVTFSVLTPDQGASFTTLALVVVSTWSTLEKKQPKPTLP